MYWRFEMDDSRILLKEALVASITPRLVKRPRGFHFYDRNRSG
jgi:hypothetical protein